MVGPFRKFACSSSNRWILPLALCTVLTGTAPVSAQDAAPAQSKVSQFVDEILESEVEFKVGLRRSKIIKMKQDVFRIAISDPEVVEVVAFGSREIEVIGRSNGSTTVTLWLGTQQQATTLSMLVTVTKDDSVEDRRRFEYGELQIMINELFPNSKIQLIPVADKLIVRGQARDEQESIQIMAVLAKNGAGGGGGGGGSSNGQQLIVNGQAADPFPDSSKLPQATIVNMVSVPGVKQVMLKVRIAELKRSALRTLGVSFDGAFKEFTYNALLPVGANTLAGVFTEGKFNLMIQALSNNGSAKILAEPNLVTLSGNTATFLSGGEFAVPTVVGVGGAQAATTSFKGFGTSINFTPTVLDHDRIRLRVSPTFSTLNKNNSVGGVFGLDTRTINTTVELREGQVFALGGLLQEEQRGDKSWVPGLGDIPVVRTFFSTKSISRDETELLILVTPELVHPIESEDTPMLLPGMQVTEPDDIEFFCKGHIEGRPNCHHRSTVWPLYRDRLCECRRNGNTQYNRSQNYYINGPHGFSE
ncbi:MAG: Type secretion system secretin RcpA/CpaC, associated with Flp pilus assembly [Planctomycetaceae bacterium]|nr:Type secretion system secretin RcpA/CpaC, associated with Flp pilus assembly [Planctomycetaceae bacterium]